MKLLSRPQAKKSIEKENQDLIESNIRLRKLEKEALSRINSAKSDYSSDKLKVLRDFEVFTKEINEKKSELLKELTDIQTEIDRKKDIYYGLVIKQDELEEKTYEITERERKVELREKFVKQIEDKLSKLTS